MSGFVIKATSVHDDEKIRWVSPGPQDSMWKLSGSTPRSDAAVFTTEEEAVQLADFIAKVGTLNDWRLSIESVD